jgi:tetratricopeptide (TPR) repeat protein
MQPLKTLLLIYILFVSYCSFAQINSSIDKDAEFRTLISNGSKAKKNADYTKALEYYTKAEAIVKKSDSKEVLFVKRKVADTYNLLSNFGEALGYYQQVLELAEKLDSKKYIAEVLSNIGLLYALEKDSKTALQYFIKAYGVANDNKLSAYIRSQVAVNISHMYNSSGQYKTAQKYLMEVENLEMPETTRQMWKTNYAESLMLEGNVAAAEKIVKQLFDNPDIDCYVCITELLSKIYDRQDKKDLAILYAKKSLNHSSRITEKIDLYDHISKIYFQTNNYSLAFKYKDSVIAAKDSMSLRINRGLYESNKVKFKVQEYKNELKANRDRQAAEHQLYIISIIFSGVLLFVMYRWLKNKQKQERKLAETKQKIVDLELESLKNNIAEKNRKLSAKALYMSGRNELIEEVINALSNISEVTSNKQVVEYMKTLKTYLKSDTEWDEFITYFEQANPNFLKTLTGKHPQLNSADIRFIYYILMNLDIREISTIFNITINAATKRKRRIKEKMGIEKEDSLYEYLTKFF